MKNDTQYWFPAKRYGWGWGLPITWQGWVITVIVVAMLVAGPFVFPLRPTPWALLMYCWLITALYLAICWLKGEPPTWRWGEK